MRGLLADVAEPVRRPGGDEDPVAGLRDERPLAEPELELAGEDLERLLLLGMDVRRGDRAVRLDERLDDDASPFVSADVVRNTSVSPVTRFVMDWPVVITAPPVWWVV